MHSADQRPPPPAVFLALEELLPPSPILVASENATPIFGYIPIEIDPSLYTAGPGDYSNIGESISASTIKTTGTFGPPRTTYYGLEIQQPLDVQEAEAEDYFDGASVSSCETISPSLARSPLSIASFAESLASQAGYYDRLNPHMQTASRFTLSAYLSSDSIATSRSPDTQLPDIQVQDHNDGDGSQDNYSVDDVQALLQTHLDTFSTLATVQFCSPTASSSMDTLSSSAISPDRWRRNVGSSSHQHALGVSKSPTGSAPPSPDVSRFLHVPTARRTRSTSSATMESSPSCVMVSSPTPSTLPPYLHWLQHTTVSFAIDQEGFRSIQPSFKFTGFSPRAGIADFMPTKRESFVFHHAPLDSAPVLRRVLVNGDASRDHISRQASLGIKSNGPYTVHGTETAYASAPGNPAPKLEWKFAYAVADRRADGSRRVMPGEKMFTPLTFSCAPDLLRPMQGQKVRLISFIKKTVAANLAAEKLEPPDCPAHIARMLDRERPVGAPTNTMDEDRGWLAVHRRAQSAVPAHMEGGRPVAARTESAPMYAPPQHVQNQPQHVQAQRPLRRMGRRRASSAGEGAFSAENAFVAGNAKRDNRTSVEDQNVPPAFSKPQPPLPIPPPSKHVMPPPSKHIMPRAELCDLLENMESTLVHVHEPRSQGLRPPPHRPVLRGARTNRL